MTNEEMNSAPEADKAEVVRETIAAFLLARDEEDIATPVSQHLINWAITCLRHGKDAVHSGDCTKESHSCSRCLTDRIYAHADQLLAALSAPVAGADAIINNKETK